MTRPPMNAHRRKPSHNGTRRISQSSMLAVFERELTYYRADAPFLPPEKCAERCELLSALLAAVTILEGHTEGANAPAAD